MATAMRALIVVMLTVLAENSGQMAFGDDEHPVEALSAYRSHPALRDRIGVSLQLHMVPTVHGDSGSSIRSTR